MITTGYQPITELKIKRSESKDICDERRMEWVKEKQPDGTYTEVYKEIICSANIIHNQYSEECSDFDQCDYYREYEDDETEGDEEPTVYDYEAGVIIK